MPSQSSMVRCGSWAKRYMLKGRGTELVRRKGSDFRSKCDPPGDHILIKEIHQARRSAGWSQRTLAERIGVNPQVIKRLEQGIGSVATLVAAMAALDFRLTGVGSGKTLHEQIRNRRQQRSRSLEQVAQRTGLSRTTIASLERGGGSAASLLRLLTLLAPQARRRAPERTYWGQGDKEDRDSRFTGLTSRFVRQATISRT